MGMGVLLRYSFTLGNFFLLFVSSETVWHVLQCVIRFISEHFSCMKFMLGSVFSRCQLSFWTFSLSNTALISFPGFRWEYPRSSRTPVTLFPAGLHAIHITLGDSSRRSSYQIQKSTQQTKISSFTISSMSSLHSCWAVSSRPCWRGKRCLKFLLSFSLLNIFPN